jgi:hypothetical protein
LVVPPFHVPSTTRSSSDVSAPVAASRLARLGRDTVATVVNNPLMKSSPPTSFMSRTTPLTPPALKELINVPFARLMRATLVRFVPLTVLKKPPT